MNRQHYVKLAGYKAYSDLKAEMTRGYLGVIWWFVEPVLYMATFYFAFAVMFKRGEGDYVSFLLCGLVFWKWFAGGVSLGCTSLISNRGIMRQVYIPKYIFPLVSVITATVKFFMVFVVLLIYLVSAGYGPSASWFWLITVFAIQFALTLGVAGVLGSLVPFLPELRGLAENGLMLLFFLSGIFFDISSISRVNADLLYLNPMAGLIDQYRNILLNGRADISMLVYPACASVILLIFAYLLLRHFDRQYPKVIMS
ncbi:MAG: ABC transporter permease [Candidatus Thiodiazotropha sp. (ex Monitilora ramsayi)]|nr:ABC transporter permease [Candidatus Thiodiazotropha sp. (ex Monitilora ramsayi)]